MAHILPTFRKAPARGPLAGRAHSTVVWHRVFRSFLYLVAWIFLLLVCIGNVSNKPVLRETYFLKLDLSNIIPLSVPNAVLINSIARSIGLHDFYQTGMWNFCEGYDNTGITNCSKPKSLYAFNPVTILLSELLSGATSTYHIDYHAHGVVANKNIPQSLCRQKSPMPSRLPKRPHTGCLVFSSPPRCSPSWASS